jgi:hypothetical protein
MMREKYQAGPLSDVFEAEGYSNTQTLENGQNIFFISCLSMVALFIFLTCRAVFLTIPKLIEGRPRRNLITRKITQMASEFKYNFFL